MASISTQRSRSFNSSSANTIRCKYDVFLSFRGEDTRGSFLEYLYRALRQKGILTFKDDDKLKDGEDIKDGLSEAIKESSFSIVVLSVNYADSSWCLDELVQILNCKKTSNHVVHPVFYHVEPTEVRKIKGKFGEGFNKAALGNEGKVEKWREALGEVANSKGWVYPSTRFENEPELIDDLVHKIFEKSIKTYPFPAEDLVGIKKRMGKVINLLDLGSDETRVVGLLGMGGIGKTTLAKVVYDAISWQFEGCSFIDNVRESLDRSGVLALQEHLISDILVENDFVVRSVMRGTSIIQNNVCRKKVLIVFDDVSEPKQLENLFGKLHWFSPGSRIIITTRNQHVLTVYGAKSVYNVHELNESEAIELFKSKAFAKYGETKEFKRLIGRAVHYATRLPLALKVLGSFLLGRSVLEWESALDRLRESTDDVLQKVLRVSFDGLHSTEKEIFLDISCFFRGMPKDRVTKILDGCDFNPDVGISELVKKCLLTISEDNNLWMHDLVQKMGWSIVDEESRKEPGERTRLWRPKDVKDVLVENTGSRKVEGIVFHPEKIESRPDAFAKMTNLRLLMIHGAWCASDLSNKLSLLIWKGYPLKCMPSTFKPEYLVELRLTNSNIEQLWDRTVVLPKLILMDLGHSISLKEGPDLSGFPNLEDLVFEGCTALEDVHPSIKKLKRLIVLNMKGCSNLQFLPSGIESQCLQTLIFSGCSKLNNILECFGELKQLSQLNLDGTDITELPQSIENFTNLSYLDLSGCVSLKSIPSSIGQLKNLKQLLLNGCYSLSTLPEEVGHIDSLEILDISFSRHMRLQPLFIHSSIVSITDFFKKQSFNKLLKEAEPITSLEKFGESHSRLVPYSASVLDIQSSIPQFKRFSFNKKVEKVKPVTSLENFAESHSRLVPHTASVLDMPCSTGQLKRCISIKLLEEGKAVSSLENFAESQSWLMAHSASVADILSSIAQLTRLEYVSNKKEFVYPSPAVCFSIPSSIGQLKNLKRLLIIGYYNLSKLPEEVGLIDGLEILDVSFSGVKQLPASVAKLRKLQKLKCKGCSKIKNLSKLLRSGFESLTMLDLSLCRLKFIPESVGLCLSLKTLILSENYFESLPTSIKNLSNLEKLKITECKSLQELPELPSSTRDVLAFGCQSLKTVCSPTVYRDARRLWFAGCPKLVENKEISIVMGHKFFFSQIKENRRRSSRVYTVPGSKIPEWIKNSEDGGSITLHLPKQDVNASNLAGFALSAVVAIKGLKCKIGVHMEIEGKFYNFGDFCTFSPGSENVIIIFYPIKYFTVDEFHMGGTVLEVCFVKKARHGKKGFYTTDQALEPALEVKACGARLIYNQEVCSGKEIDENQSLAK